jgi:hypothetical protein
MNNSKNDKAIIKFNKKNKGLMKSEEEPIIFFRFLKENSVLFTSGALFAAFYYYIITLLKDPTTKLNSLNSTILHTAYSQQSPEVQQILDQASSLQITAVISFLVFAIILSSIIVISYRYDIVSNFFALLLILFLFYSFVYLIASFKESLYSVLAIYVPLAFFIFYQEILEHGRKAYQANNPSYLGLFWFSILDILLILCAEILHLLKIILPLVNSVEFLYFALFLLFWLLIIIAAVGMHLISFVMFFFRERKSTLSEFNDVV